MTNSSATSFAIFAKLLKFARIYWCGSACSAEACIYLWLKRAIPKLNERTISQVYGLKSMNPNSICKRYLKLEATPIVRQTVVQRRRALPFTGVNMCKRIYIYNWIYVTQFVEV